MAMILLILSILSYSDKELVIDDPAPEDWRQFEYKGDGILLWEKSFTCTVRPVGTVGMRQRLLEAGLTEDQLEEPYFKEMVERMAGFTFDIVNRGQHDLNFNPNQVTLSRIAARDAVQVDAADFMTSLKPLPPNVEQALARFLSKSSIKIDAGQRRTHFIVFRPSRKGRFIQIRHTLTINQLFYGVDVYKLSCSFDFDYRRVK